MMNTQCYFSKTLTRVEIHIKITHKPVFISVRVRDVLKSKQKKYFSTEMERNCYLRLHTLYSIHVFLFLEWELV
jgi:hypothetical protein